MITANDLKIKGVKLIEQELSREPEAVITVRGRKQFVVMDLERYNYLRECELEAALLEARADVAAGRFVVEDVAAHLARIDRES